MVRPRALPTMGPPQGVSARMQPPVPGAYRGPGWWPSHPHSPPSDLGPLPDHRAPLPHCPLCPHAAYPSGAAGLCPPCSWPRAGGPSSPLSSIFLWKVPQQALILDPRSPHTEGLGSARPSVPTALRPWVLLGSPAHWVPRHRTPVVPLPGAWLPLVPLDGGAETCPGSGPLKPALGKPSQTRPPPSPFPA